MDSGDSKCLSFLEILSKYECPPTSLEISQKYADLFESHDKLIGVIKSLQAKEYIKTSPLEKAVWWISAEGDKYATSGTPEYRLVSLLKEAKNDKWDAVKIRSEFGTEGDVAISNAMKLGWISIDKSTKEISVKENITHTDDTCLILNTIKTHYEYDIQTDKDTEEELFSKLTAITPQKKPSVLLQELKKRKLVESRKIKYFSIAIGPCFSLTLHKSITDLTAKVLLDNSWKQGLKPYNFFSSGKKVRRGSTHPLMRVMKQFKQILMSMGFSEMATNQYAESSFWCFDSLFMPQQHPARDVQDTFFLKNPESSDLAKMPEAYINRVKEMHEHGGAGSTGWQYKWSLDESLKNIMRTHTTATSSRILYQIAQEYKATGVIRSQRLYSIDRVFRNETLDATHLAEFHQVEGVVIGHGLSLGHLIGVMTTFYKAIGIESLKFKAAYNPYTEPSMEIFGYHPGLKKWIEVGNSGIFRPEMLLPMGLPEDISVIAWGLSLERPTMIKYGISNIRQLFGHKANIGAA